MRSFALALLFACGEAPPPPLALLEKATLDGPHRLGPAALEPAWIVELRLGEASLSIVRGGHPVFEVEIAHVDVVAGCHDCDDGCRDVDRVTRPPAERGFVEVRSPLPELTHADRGPLSPRIVTPCDPAP